ncbi:MAG: hypothetical protein ACOYYS_25020 [Chloroflexota bacterium]
MTMNHRVFEDLEIAFWNATIPAMTRVRKIRLACHHVRLTLRRAVPRQVLLSAVVWSVIGLTIGISIGLLLASL